MAVEETERRGRKVSHHGGIALEPEAAKAFRRAMAVRGWTPEDVAKRAGVSHSTVARMVRGEGVTHRSLRQVTEALKQGRVNPDLAALIDGRFDEP